MGSGLGSVISYRQEHAPAISATVMVNQILEHQRARFYFYFLAGRQ